MSDGTPRGQKWVSEILVPVGEFGEIWNWIVFLKDIENLRNIKVFSDTEEYQK